MLQNEYKDKVRSLERFELSCGEFEASRARKQQAMGAQQLAINESYLKDVASEEMVRNLEAENEVLLEELRSYQVSEMGSRHDKEETVKQEAQIQAMISQQREIQ